MTRSRHAKFLVRSHLNCLISAINFGFSVLYCALTSMSNRLGHSKIQTFWPKLRNFKQGLGIAILICGLAENSLALTTDIDKPYHISAKESAFFQQTHSSSFSGNVVATQGSSKITADKLTFYFDKENQKLLYFVAIGKPATYSTQLNDKKGLLRSKARLIKYDLSEKTLIFKGNAEVVRGGSQITGSYISYNLEKQVIQSKSTEKPLKTTITIDPEDTR